MPLFEFYCADCQNVFEEICKENSRPVCPHCNSQNTEIKISAPSPLKKGAFPFKPGPVHPLASRMGSGQGCSACPSGGGKPGGCGK